MSGIRIRRDARGLHVRTGGYVFRPGAIRGYERSHRMDDAGLAEGDVVKARHRGGTPLARLTLADGTTVHWAEQETAAASGVETPDGLLWRGDGMRDLKPERNTAAEHSSPRPIDVLDGAAMTALLTSAVAQG